MNGTNLPTATVTDSSESVKQFFDKYYKTTVSFPASQIDATVAFFAKRGFSQDSARSTAIVLLNQARIDGVEIFQILDTMKGLTDIQLNQIVAQILNAYRESTSLLGIRVSPTINPFESRNVLI